MDPAPPNARAFVFGAADYGGLSGWMIKQLNGDEDFYAVEVPEEWTKVTVSFQDVSEGLQSRDAIDLIEEYLGKLEGIVAGSRRVFLG